MRAKDHVGFTLVELLVVISVIALLMAILLPYLQKARAQAKRTACLAQLRSIGHGIHIYADEHDGKLIPGDHSLSWAVWGKANEGGCIQEDTEPDEDLRSQPVNLGHLLAQETLPLPTNNDNVLFCPSSRLPEGIPPSEGFIGKWGGNGQEATATYMFNTALDGFGNQFYPDIALQTGSVPFFSHKTAVNYLLGDGSAHVFKLQRRVFPGSGKPEWLYEFYARVGLSSPTSLVHQWFEKGDINVSQLAEFYADPQAWGTEESLQAKHRPVLLANAAKRSLVADVISVTEAQQKDPTQRRG